MNWRRLIRIEEDFDLIEIETPSIHIDWSRTEKTSPYNMFGLKNEI
jgi:hypothetical protein